MHELVDGEYRFFDLKDDEPYFSTQEFHNDREAAPHIEQHGMQRDRLVLAAEFIKELINKHGITTVSDLCCGDGGLLEYLKPFFEANNVTAWGYDFQPANVRDAIYKRKVDVSFADVMNDDIEFGELSIMTECLEHFADPHAMVKRVSKNSDFFVISGPNGETPEAHYEFHTWGWSWPAYEKLLTNEQYKIVRHEESTIFQVMAGVKAE
jgi:2-polyprenyl-3-methyl-5-hydroxy-6-metoxy-1,4-benzoquinol methylase